MNAIDIDGIMSTIREDHRDKLNVSALADYLEEINDVVKACWVREHLATRIPADIYENGQAGWWLINYWPDSITDPDDLPKWLWDKLSVEHADVNTSENRKLYPDEYIAYTRLFDALLKGINDDR